MTTRKQKEAAKKGLLAEKRVARWLIDRGWTHIHYHRRHHAGPFDIDCKKKGESWLIEVKTGEKPSVKIANLVRMLEAKRNDRVDKAALTFVPSNVRKPLLMFAMDKPKYVALKASIKRAGSEAARKAWRTDEDRKPSSSSAARPRLRTPRPPQGTRPKPGAPMPLLHSHSCQRLTSVPYLADRRLRRLQGDPNETAPR